MPGIGLSLDQLLLFLILAGLLVLLVWGRWRFDLVAFGTLMMAVVVGIVPAREAFSGFGHPATVTVALVLVVSRLLAEAGATDSLARLIGPFTRHTSLHAGALASIGALLSGFMNNVGTLALLMPLALETCAKAKRPVGLVLMPLSFATILGGLVTLIGTPPNIIVSGYRAAQLGEPYRMFDYTPVGGTVMLAGLLFIALLGWRLVPQREGRTGPGDRFDIETYLAEAKVSRGGLSDGKTVAEIYKQAGNLELQIVGLIHRGRRTFPVPNSEVVRSGMRLLIEAKPEEIEKITERLGLKLGQAKGGSLGLLESDTSHVLEALVPVGARAEGRTVEQLRFVRRWQVSLLGVSRQGRPHRGRLRDFRLRVGDILLLHGDEERLADVVGSLGLLPLAERGLRFGQRAKAPLLVALFAAAVALAATGFVPIYIALGLALGGMVLTNLVPLRGLYEGIDWPVIVLLGSLIPVGGALQTTGGTEVIAASILGLTAGGSAVLVLVLLMVVTMTISDVLNNAATAVVMAPIGAGIAERLGASPDPFLMAVAVAASCAFLTPIGHQNNALILGPGGYRFWDYWRMGLPLEALIVAVAVPTILVVWPL